MSRARSHLRAALFLAAASARGITTQVAARRGLSAWPVPQEPSMEYQDAVRMLNTLQTNAGYLEQVKRQRGDPQTQLEAMELYLARSGLQVEDLDRLNIIHVTGTKGKGSTCAFTECILRSYGLKTGFFSSPHLVQVRERIRINGQPISPELFTKYFWRLYHRLEETKDGSCVSMPPYFRFLTLMAFHVFLQEKVDLAVVEVGIGGAYDCTNIIRKPVVCGVSSLGIDHTSLLGDTVEKIAWQKGGIFKQGVPAFTVLQPEGPLAVLRDRAQQISVLGSQRHPGQGSCGSCPWHLCSSPHPTCGSGFGTRSGRAGRRCCGAGPSPGTWTVRTPPAARRPACAGSARRCRAARGRAVAPRFESCSSMLPGTGTRRPC
ncbi:folylpolyglutamate synthase [Homo sapiens]|uniref:Folylpolyglutamate synthase n=2 Tax=Homo sapiens TaxID=9606 RepID=Q5JU23_HUMAN|nr:folylpolyglutamate synthase [Homo sapiens]KAI2554044.1 folylpolyglutamate synthase [Homo sapiens]